MAGLAGDEEFMIRAATVDDVEVLARHRCEMFKDMGQLRQEHYRELAFATACGSVAALRQHVLICNFLADLPSQPSVATRCRPLTGNASQPRSSDE